MSGENGDPETQFLPSRSSRLPPPREVSRALLQPEVELCPKVEVIENLFIFPEQDLPQGLHVRNSLLVCLSQAGGHLLRSGIPLGRRAVGRGKRQAHPQRGS